MLRRDKDAELCRALLADSGSGPIHVLDVGCGDGRLLERVIARLPEGRFRLILLASYLEHEIQPLPVLRRCRALLAESGHVVVKVPNHACWNRWLRGARWCGYRWPDHVNYFTPHTLGAMAARAGLRVARMAFRDRHPLSDSLYAVLTRARP